MFNTTLIRLPKSNARHVLNTEATLARWFKLDEASGTTALDSAGSNNGTLVNTPTWIAGKVGGGLRFAAASSQRVDHANFTANAFTIAAWIRWGTLTGGLEMALAFDNFADSPRDEIVIGNNNSSSAFYIEVVTDDVGGAVTPSATTADWNHVALVRSTTTVTVYINGVDAGTPITVGSGSRTFVNGRLGCHFFSGSNTRHSNVDLDDVRFYTRALTAAQVLTLATRPPGSRMIDSPIFNSPMF